MMRCPTKLPALVSAIALCSSSLLWGCSSTPSGENESSLTGAAQESVPATPGNGTAEEAGAAALMRNISLKTVPDNYYQPAENQGTLEPLTYNTKDYIGNGKDVEHSATVYLPYGYRQDDSTTEYNILYLQHGAYGNERTWMYEYGDQFKNMIDNMIEDGSIPPLIIVMPHLFPGNEWYHDTTPVFYSGEIRNDLMPAVESRYHTYAQDVTDEGFTASRSHRAFGGFSAGGTTTWTVLLEGLDRFEYFLPMSGGLALGGDGSTGEQDAASLANAATASGYGKRDYFVFAATGTRDVAYSGLSSQIEQMRPLTTAFDFTESGFADGNLMYYTVQGNRHDYPYTYEYVYNGLRCLFSWATLPE